MQTAIVGASTVSIRTESADGVASTPSVVTVTGVAHDGTAVVLTSVTIGSPVVGTHTATLTVPDPTLVTLTWTVDGLPFTDPVDVVGRMPVAVSELGNSDTTLTSAAGSALRDAIEQAHDECRSITGRSWVRRYDVGTFTARAGRVSTGWSDIARVGAVTVDDVAWTAGQIAEIVIRPLTGTLELAVCDGAVVEVGVEHGVREPTPRVRQALLIRARQHAQAATSKVPLYSERVVIGVDGGSVVRMLPGANRTGVAEVDAVYSAVAWGGMGLG